MIKDSASSLVVSLKDLVSSLVVIKDLVSSIVTYLLFAATVSGLFGGLTVGGRG